MARTSDALGESGLTADEAAGSLARVYATLTGTEVPEQLEPWEAVAVRAMAMLDGDSDTELSFRQLAGMLRRAYGRACGLEVDPEDPVPAASAAGWEGVARHAANVFAMGPEEARRLFDHEARIVSFMQAKAPAA